MYIEIPVTVGRDFDPDDDENTITYAVKVFDRPVFYKKFDKNDSYYIDEEGNLDEVKDEFAKRLAKALAQ